ncbi:FMN-binding negative transcriptional regulator [Salinicola avicenniae]|uniref:FMN-binding negative transcriptional regulator n=1 Tax=Salinicola avicenniae TaxID=2916836 RepID=UPI0020748139|nr:MULTISPECIES: FMN-binding negative transcriptional regulator [unclassified Salinicola]
MYLPDRFRLDSPVALARAIDDAPFATLVTTDDTGAISTDHLPLLRYPGEPPMPMADNTDWAASLAGALRGHVARANPLAALAAPRSAMAIFHGPQAYISPSIYPAKREHGRVVPTWNYQVVQVRGQLRLIDEPAWLRSLVTDLTARFETERPAPWAVNDAPATFIDALCQAIVGVELTIVSVDGKRKASQHRPRAEREAIQHDLRVTSGLDAMAARTLSGLDEA